MYVIDNLVLFVSFLELTVKPENKVCKKGGGVYNNLKNVVIYIYIYIIEGAKVRKREKDGTKMN